MTNTTQTSAAPRPLGAHMSIAGKLTHAIDCAHKVDADALQIFTKNQRRWTSPVLKEDAAESFRAALEASSIRYLCAHAGYLINLASAKPETRANARESLIDELQRADALNCDCLVLHPGSPTSAGREQGIAWITEGLTAALNATPNLNVSIALENTAGQGTCLGSTFAELGEMIKAVDNHPRLTLCLDTCHAFAAGYDLRYKKALDDMVAEIDTHIGLDRLRVMHLNDSMKECGCRVDRHQHIGQGCIGEKGFSNLLNHPAFCSIPGILETPKDDKTLAEDKVNLALLHRLIQE